jgi:hypothetical protein
MPTEAVWGFAWGFSRSSIPLGNLCGKACGWYPRPVGDPGDHAIGKSVWTAAASILFIYCREIPITQIDPGTRVGQFSIYTIA